MEGGAAATGPARLRIAFFDHPDVFEDFYPHYGIDQRGFAERFADTGNHAWVAMLERELGDVTWYAFSLAPELDRARHLPTGCEVRFLRSSLAHRWLWRAFYLSRAVWRHRQRLYPLYAPLAAYSSLLSCRFLRTIVRERPDVFFLQDYASGRFDVLVLLARRLGVPLVAYHSGSRPERWNGRWLRGLALRRADALLASSADEAEMLARRFRVARRRIVVALTPIDLEAYRPGDRAAACRASGLDPGRRHLLFVGRLDDGVKRVSALIAAFAPIARLHPQLDLIIAGAGPDEPSLRRQAGEAAPGRIRFLGWVAGAAAKAALYNTAELLVLCSIREGFPTVVGEAMACGTPVLSTRVGGVPELVGDGDGGWLVAAGDEPALAARLATLAAAPARLLAMREAARRRAEERLAPAVLAGLVRGCLGRVESAHV